MMKPTACPKVRAYHLFKKYYSMRFWKNIFSRDVHSTLTVSLKATFCNIFPTLKHQNKFFHVLRLTLKWSIWYWWYLNWCSSKQPTSLIRCTSSSEKYLRRLKNTISNFLTLVRVLVPFMLFQRMSSHLQVVYDTISIQMSVCTLNIFWRFLVISLLCCLLKFCCTENVMSHNAESQFVVSRRRSFFSGSLTWILLTDWLYLCVPAEMGGSWLDCSDLKS